MKVDIKRSEKTKGVIFKKTQYVVSLTVQFSEEEKQVIKECDLGKYTLVERPQRAGINETGNAPDIWHLRVRHLLSGKPDEYEFENLGEANKYNDAIVPALKELKEYIENNSAPATDTSIEL